MAVAGYNTASGTGGAGGGGYSKITSSDLSVAANATIYTSVGAGGSSNVAGGDTWANATSNAAPTLTSQGVLAKGGASGQSGTTGGSGGLATSGVGSTKFSGGNGGTGVSGTNAGGGGAASAAGNGGQGGSGVI